MNKKEYQNLYQQETTYWWHVGRRLILKKLLNKYFKFKGGKILDIGCGTGETTKLLSKFGDVFGVDKAKEAVNACKKRGFSNIKLGYATELPYQKNSFSLITMLDLLEHIENDSKALKESFRTLEPGGFLFITVPAWNFLWGDHDRALQHKRRYTKNELKRKIRKSGFEPKKLSYAISILFSPIVILRTFQNLFIKREVPQTSYIELPQWLNTFFISLLEIEATLLPYINFPLGISIICIAKKPAH